MSLFERVFAMCCGFAIASSGTLLGAEHLMPVSGEKAALHRTALPRTVEAQSVAPQLTPIGSERSLAGALPGDQVQPHAAVGPDGGLVVWQDNSVTSLGLRIRAQRLNGGFLPVGSPTAVSSAWNSKTAGEQEKPQAALFSDGSAIVVWQTMLFTKKQTGYQIFARCINANGVPVGKDIRVNTNRKANQTSPVAAALGDSVVVVWSSLGQDGSLQGIFAQRLSPTGKKLGKEFRVNQWTENNQRTPAVAALSGGGFVVAWVSELQRGAASVDIYARLYNAGGSPIGGEFPINVSTTKACANPSLVGSPEGGFAIVWSQKDDAGLAASVARNVSAVLSPDSWDVFGRLFDADGSAQVAPFRINTRTYGDQYAPKVAMLNGSYLSVWTSLGQDGSREGIFGQAFASNGDFQGSEFRVNDTTVSRQIHPTVSSIGAQFAVTWSSIVAGTGFDLFAQTYLQTSGQ